MDRVIFPSSTWKFIDPDAKLLPFAPDRVTETAAPKPAVPFESR